MIFCEFNTTFFSPDHVYFLPCRRICCEAAHQNSRTLSTCQLSTLSCAAYPHILPSTTFLIPSQTSSLRCGRHVMQFGTTCSWEYEGTIFRSRSCAEHICRRGNSLCLCCFPPVRPGLTRYIYCIKVLSINLLSTQLERLQIHLKYTSFCPEYTALCCPPFHLLRYGFLGLPGYLGGKAIEDPEIKKKKLPLGRHMGVPSMISWATKETSGAQKWKRWQKVR